MSRLVVVSNRIAPPDEHAASAGGLAVGILGALKAAGGLWFGWSGETGNEDQPLKKVKKGNITWASFNLSEQDLDEYYNKFSNAVLWPAFHYRLDLVQFQRPAWDGYLRVNALLADKLLPLLQDDDIIWIHDYHLLPFAHELRKRGVNNRIGFFLHIPFPTPEIFNALPTYDTLLEQLCDYDLLGFQTENDRLAFLDCLSNNSVGNLILSAEHQGGNICIEVTDDGAGLNRERILAKAASQGLTVSENMSDDEVAMLIFAPGFSTAEQVTDVSGRGVGMDVVKRNIQEMGGHVEIQSMQGTGTTIRILLPLTLAILDGMSVRVADEVFILPLNAVMESLQPREADLHPLAGDERVLEVRGEYLPIVELWKVFNVAGAKTEATQGIVVILQSGGRRYALLVDQLIGQHQVVVKNLESNYRKVPGISAATILGDGSVALIVDVSALQAINREQRMANTAA